MTETISFILMCLAGVACFWLFYKCMDWFEKI